MSRPDSEVDEFWNSSNIKSFDFDGNENSEALFGVSKSGTTRLSQQVQASISGQDFTGVSDSLTGSTTTAPTHTSPPLLSLISEESLRRILEADLQDEFPFKNSSSSRPEEELKMLRRQVQAQYMEPPIDVTVRNIFLGRPHSLDLYRSLSSKKALLENAVCLGDGNAILEIVLFLVRTLKKSLLHQILSSQPVAATHYAKYLATRLQVSELTDLLEMLGKSKEAAMKQYQLCTSTQNPQRQVQKLKSCISSHFLQGDNRLRQLALNHVALLEWQQGVGAMDNVDLIGKSVVQCLAHACENHWDDPRGSPTNPFALAQTHGVSDRQLQWTILSQRASLKAWPDIDSVFLVKNWLGSGVKLKMALPLEKVLNQLHAKEAPTEVLIKYLGFLDSIEKRIALAQQLGCHKAVIDGYVALRDRQGLQGYKATLHPGSESFLYAEGVLRVSATKWKN